jgi:hypothetical protein
VAKRRSLEDEPKTPSWLRCGACGHMWILMYLPMPMDTAARVMKAAHCPMCGQNAKKLFIADPPRKPSRVSPYDLEGVHRAMKRTRK